jgi:hypothetical protein
MNLSNASTGYMTIATLTTKELATLLEAIPRRRPQARELIEFVAANPHASTADVNKAVVVGNISQESTAANKKLFYKGLMLGCMRPPVPLKNQFKQDSAPFLWSLYRLPEGDRNEPA